MSPRKYFVTNLHMIRDTSSGPLRNIFLGDIYRNGSQAQYPVPVAQTILRILSTPKQAQALPMPPPSNTSTSPPQHLAGSGGSGGRPLKHTTYLYQQNGSMYAGPSTRPARVPVRITYPHRQHIRRLNNRLNRFLRSAYAAHCTGTDTLSPNPPLKRWPKTTPCPKLRSAFGQMDALVAVYAHADAARCI